jgi:hypothetical protein
MKVALDTNILAYVGLGLPRSAFSLRVMRAAARQPLLDALLAGAVPSGAP